MCVRPEVDKDRISESQTPTADLHINDECISFTALVDDTDSEDCIGVEKSDGGNRGVVVDDGDYISDINASIADSSENLPSRCADYLLAGGDAFFEYDSEEDMYI